MPFDPTYDYTDDAVLRSWRASLQRLGLPAGRLTVACTYWRADSGELHRREVSRALRWWSPGHYRICDPKAHQCHGLAVHEIELCLDVRARVRS